MYKQYFTLPSDSSLREDLNFFIKDDETNAQLYKEKYEQVQRNDRELRLKFQKEQ
jgi:hypothetical protein